MRKIVVILFSMCMLMSFCPKESQWDDVGIAVVLHISGPIDETLNGGMPHAPIKLPSVYIDEHILSVIGTHPDYLVRIVDNNDVLYETQMPSTVNNIILPSTLSGNFQVQLICGNWMFYGRITL